MPEGERFQYIAKTLTGLEPALAGELEAIGAGNIKPVTRGVIFSGDLEIMYRANYCCRSAIRIIRQIARFKASNPQQLYDGVRTINWQELFSLQQTFAVKADVFSSAITHSKYAALKTKDAIADQFRDALGRRPNVNTQNPDLLIQVRIHRNECTLSIDSSGESLHKRGYRVANGPAPLSEVLAAGMILLSDWDRQSHFIDPMCGSGTLPIEAALIAYNIPPGYFREEFGFEKWNDFDKQLWEKVKNEANAKIKETVPFKIIGSDWSGRIMSVARENRTSAGLDEKIELKTGFFEDMVPPPAPGVVITNPPYGERIKPDDIRKLYRMIGDTLKQKFQGYSAWILSGHPDALKMTGLHASPKYDLMNGPIACKFAGYKLYEGSLKNNNSGKD
ncbi:MAG: THUMP domain-containing protein [Bacteroidales bacterium]